MGEILQVEESTTGASGSMGGSQTGASVPHSDDMVEVDGELWHRIVDVDRMPAFLVSVVSAGDQWMYVSSRGGLTAGRVNEDGALFPYETDDKLHECHAFTGPVTVMRVEREGKTVVWEPFREGPAEGVRRSLLKTVAGNQLMLEEVHLGIGLTYRYRWASSEDFGFVRTVTLENHSGAAVKIDVIDGVLNLVPANVSTRLQRNTSCLVNAYTRCDVDGQTGLAAVALSAMIVDQAKPAESLRTTVAWCVGLEKFEVLLSTDQVEAFRSGEKVGGETVLKGRRGNYLVAATLEIPAGSAKSWDIVADVNRGHIEVENLRALLLSGGNVREHVARSVRAGTDDLLRNVASADGLQATADREASTHHYANVMFNNMRGGVFAHHCGVPTKDFGRFVHERNVVVHHRHEAALRTLPPEIPVSELLSWAQQAGDVDLVRLTYEYLPITFSRRHGDPSRPWNKFNIRVKNPDGTRALTYQGNWRDIFQNWEALCASFPCFLENVIAKFVNASTVDGFNPYRITREGIDWEMPEPEDPFANIGYWGDHQIVYLLRLLEASKRNRPGVLEGMLTRRMFTYAQVPYRIKDYAAIVANPRETIAFDHPLHKQLMARAKQIGADGKLVQGEDGGVYHVTLAEKLLVPILAKLSNLVVDGGIWLNTQRPEWNDANNALVGNGLSMVTLCYLRRHLAFCKELFLGGAEPAAEMSLEVQVWMRAVLSILRDNHPILMKNRAVSDAERRRVLDALGEAFSNYRRGVYARGFSGSVKVSLDEAGVLFTVALDYLDHAIAANRREDGLYHSYNLLGVATAGKAKVELLYEMLEGQVAVLSAGVLRSEQAADVIERLYESRMYREDQKSFMLYPERELATFFEKNVVSEGLAREVPLLAALVGAGDASLLGRDAVGKLRFNSALSTVDDLNEALDKLARDGRWAGLVAQHREAVIGVFSEVFALRSFTGRSGTMYGYEGLGCIYWHMVAKLLLAVQENYLAVAETGSLEITERLAGLYYRVRSGLGFTKSATVYGAFPTDPYSHTPMHAGAQQPGMTGQVKEEVLTRFGELGVVVERGRLAFQPRLLRRSEFFTAGDRFRYLDGEDRWQTLELAAGSLAFTLGQVPVVYRLTNEAGRVRLVGRGGQETVQEGLKLDRGMSLAILARTGEVSRVEVEVPEWRLWKLG